VRASAIDCSPPSLGVWRYGPAASGEDYWIATGQHKDRSVFHLRGHIGGNHDGMEARPSEQVQLGRKKGGSMSTRATNEDLKVAFPSFKGKLTHLRTLLTGVEVWNEWLRKNPKVIPDLSAVDLSPKETIPPGDIWVEGDDGRFFTNLSGAKLNDTILDSADLSGPTLAARLTTARA
jgi:hypothetical protein